MAMRHRIFSGPRRQAWALAGLSLPALLALPHAARADVYEITAGGTMRARSGAGAVHWAGVDVAAAQPGDGPEPAALPFGSQVEALTQAGASLSPAAWREHLRAAAEGAAISPALLEALVWQESRWRPQAVSSAGAVGLGQLMPGTARTLGVNPRDPVANLRASARYLKSLLDRFDGNIEWALAAYNAGPERVARAGGIPAIAETRAYVRAVMGRLNANLAGVSR
ncbi:lytic transglycosylase domain-containing protein [Novosphingobium pokkalii]|uniref:Lytic transglycosylase domain-containing protein n=2 Tax=Novosphingobium pokkalii TaxID=1770194 RepID=A0ABV7V2N1_9SPHN|nr:hypothetical protein GCM10019060_21090 [Novosphingobium pokkalii]